MKKITYFFIALLTFSIASYSQVGIGTETPHESSIVDVDVSGLAVKKGLLPPRLTRLQRNAIANPANGLIVYTTDAQCIQFFNDANEWFDACDKAIDLTPVTEGITVTAITYNGTSIIDNQGIGYTGEAVPAASTIDIEVNTTIYTYYNFEATDATSGLTYSASGYFNTPGTYTVTLNHNEATIGDLQAGTLTMPLTGANNAINLEPRIDITSIPVNETQIVEVDLGPAGIWMDRNLGARQAATSENDGLAFGSLYQWARESDGHEVIVTHGDNPSIRKGLNGTRSTLSTTSSPGHSDFITTSTDWITPQDSGLWNTNNPCPSGWRPPSNAEYRDMHTALGLDGQGLTEAATSPLKFSATGRRINNSGDIEVAASTGGYWTRSTPSPILGRERGYNNSPGAGGGVFQGSTERGFGLAIRCIKI